MQSEVKTSFLQKVHEMSDSQVRELFDQSNRYALMAVSEIDSGLVNKIKDEITQVLKKNDVSNVLAKVALIHMLGVMDMFNSVQHPEFGDDFEVLSLAIIARLYECAFNVTKEKKMRH